MATITPIRTTPSAEILRAREVLCAILARWEDADADAPMMGSVMEELELISMRLSELAGLHKIFEAYHQS